MALFVVYDIIDTVVVNIFDNCSDVNTMFEPRAVLSLIIVNVQI